MDLLKKIKRNHNLSVRTYNVCRANKLNTLDKICTYYLEHNRSFLNLKNCGQKSNLELIAICMEYKGESLEKDTIYVNPILEKIHSFTDAQKDILLKTYRNSLSSLNVRTKNIIDNFDGFLRVPGSVSTRLY